MTRLNFALVSNNVAFMEEQCSMENDRMTSQNDLPMTVETMRPYCSEHEYIRQSVREIYNTMTYEFKEAKRDRRELIEAINTVNYLKATVESLGKEFDTYREDRDGKLEQIEKEVSGWGTAKKFLLALALFFITTGIWQVAIWLISIYKKI